MLLLCLACPLLYFFQINRFLLILQDLVQLSLTHSNSFLSMYLRFEQVSVACSHNKHCGDLVAYLFFLQDF